MTQFGSSRLEIFRRRPPHSDRNPSILRRGGGKIIAFDLATYYRPHLFGQLGNRLRDPDICSARDLGALAEARPQLLLIVRCAHQRTIGVHGQRGRDALRALARVVEPDGPEQPLSRRSTSTRIFEGSTPDRCSNCSLTLALPEASRC